jgi:hypothetical protein
MKIAIRIKTVTDPGAGFGSGTCYRLKLAEPDRIFPPPDGAHPSEMS